MQRYFSNKLIDNKFTLSDDDMYHIKRVMRMKAKDLVEVVYDNELYICSLDDDFNALIKEKNIHNKDNMIETVLLIPLLKEQKMDFILQKATELGVKEIIPVVMERSIIKVDKNKIDNKLQRWVKICKEASEQSKRVDIPIIREIMDLKDLGCLEGVKIVCSTQETSTNIKNFMQTNKKCDRINVVIGPEGGISSKEEELLVEKGFQRVSLGNRILRVETVPLFILSALNYEYME